MELSQQPRQFLEGGFTEVGTGTLNEALALRRRNGVNCPCASMLSARHPVSACCGPCVRLAGKPAASVTYILSQSTNLRRVARNTDSPCPEKDISAPVHMCYQLAIQRAADVAHASDLQAKLTTL